MKGLQGFQPHERLRTPTEYQRVKKKGTRFRATHFGVNFVPNDLQFHRLGMVVQKRFWSAVRRNRIKRCLREWFRLHKHEIPLPGKDIVVIAHPGAQNLSPVEIARELLAAFAAQDVRSS
ncbi:MAG: ribonuclease P protein component [Syntrophobacteraceae bacterium]